MDAPTSPQSTPLIITRDDTLVARIFLRDLYDCVIGRPVTYREMHALYPLRFPAYIALGIAMGQIDRRLGWFDLDRIAAALESERDFAFDLASTHTLYDQHLLQHGGAHYELPQWFWMRIAMGLTLAKAEADWTDRTIACYHRLSSAPFFDLTPTLLSAGTRRVQSTPTWN